MKVQYKRGCIHILHPPITHGQVDALAAGFVKHAAFRLCSGISLAGAAAEKLEIGHPRNNEWAMAGAEDQRLRRVTSQPLSFILRY